jgi:hypothetical protein
MTCYNNDELSAPGMTANKYEGNDWHWAFQGQIYSDPVYQSNFEEDIGAIAESVGDDSGYFSNDPNSFEARNSDVASYDERFPSACFGNKPSLSSNTFFADVATSTSNKSIHGSIYNGTRNKSMTHLEKPISYSKQPKETRSKTLYHHVHEYEHKTPHKYSAMEPTSSRPLSLEKWANTNERHEWIAYQLQEPATPQSSKRRKTSGRK